MQTVIDHYTFIRDARIRVLTLREAACSRVAELCKQNVMQAENLDDAQLQVELARIDLALAEIDLLNAAAAATKE